MDSEIKALAHKRASLCSIFGNTRRVLIVWALGDREMSVSAIAATLDISLQNTSQHLRLMKDKGVLQSRRDGKAVLYRIADNKLKETCPVLLRAKEIQFTKDSVSHKQKEYSHD